MEPFMVDRTEDGEGSSSSSFVIDDQDLGIFLSCLLNAKFNDELRTDFLVAPFLNDLISQLIERGRQRGASSLWFSEEPVFALPEHELNNDSSIFGKIARHLQGSERPENYDAMLGQALFPYSVVPSVSN
jgi:hypothetical protein